jgi:hypothetical protein
LLKRMIFPFMSAAMMASTDESMRRSRNSLVFWSSSAVRRAAVTSRKEMMAVASPSSMVAAKTERMTRRPFWVVATTSISRRISPRPMDQSRSTMSPSSVGLVRALTCLPFASAMLVSSISAPEGFKVSTHACLSRMATPSETFAK